MSTFKDFVDAPVGATATSRCGEKAIKTFSRLRTRGLWVSESTTFYDPFDMAAYGFTLDPPPEPLPDWLDAPAVLATCLECNGDGLVNSVHVNFIDERWACTECHRTLPWIELTDVTPLYPKEQDA